MYQRNKPHTLGSLLARTDAVGDCLVWKGATNKKNGYGVAVWLGKQTTVHRIVYQMVHGDIPPNSEVDHMCNVRGCINPDHLQLVTHQQNMELGASRRKTCRNGHEWSDKNTYITKVKRKQGGFRMQRYCRVCRCKHQADLRKRTT